MKQEGMIAGTSDGMDGEQSGRDFARGISSFSSAPTVLYSLDKSNSIHFDNLQLTIDGIKGKIIADKYFLFGPMTAASAIYDENFNTNGWRRLQV